MNSTYTKKESRAVVMLMGCETVDLELQGRISGMFVPNFYVSTFMLFSCEHIHFGELVVLVGKYGYLR
jgi:hypothetical protein